MSAANPKRINTKTKNNNGIKIKLSEMSLRAMRMARPALTIMNVMAKAKRIPSGMNARSKSAGREMNNAGMGHPPSASVINSISVKFRFVVFFKTAKVNTIPQSTNVRVARISSQSRSKTIKLFTNRSAFEDKVYGLGYAVPGTGVKIIRGGLGLG
jgi:hypothetical protein